MKYIGKKSVSSVINVILKIAWWLLLAAMILFTLVVFFKLFSIDLGERLTEDIAKLDMADAGQNWLLWFDYSQIATWPMIGKIIAFASFLACGVLRLWILRTVQRMFANFTQDTIFDYRNIKLLSTASVFFVISSVLNWSFGMLMVSLLMVILCEIFKKGSRLQEEQDLTV
jgi:hypothetical protein